MDWGDGWIGSGSGPRHDWREGDLGKAATRYRIGDINVEGTCIGGEIFDAPMTLKREEYVLSQRQ